MHAWRRESSLEIRTLETSVCVSPPKCCFHGDHYRQVLLPVDKHQEQNCHTWSLKAGETQPCMNPDPPPFLLEGVCVQDQVRLRVSQQLQLASHAYLLFSLPRPHLNGCGFLRQFSTSSRLHSFPATSPAGMSHTGCSKLPISLILLIGLQDLRWYSNMSLSYIIPQITEITRSYKYVYRLVYRLVYQVIYKLVYQVMQVSILGYASQYTRLCKLVACMCDIFTR